MVTYQMNLERKHVSATQAPQTAPPSTHVPNTVVMVSNLVRKDVQNVDVINAQPWPVKNTVTMGYNEIDMVAKSANVKVLLNNI